MHRIAPRPLLLAHGDRNELHRPEESRRLHERTGGSTELLLLEDSGHTEWMFDEHPTYHLLMRRVAAFFLEAVGKGGG